MRKHKTHKEEYDYDASGKLSTINKYDASGRLESQEEYKYYPSGKLSTINKYDASGRLESQEEYKYYELGNIKTKTEFDDNGNKLTQTEYWTEDKSVEIYASYLKKKEEIIYNKSIKILAIYIITLAALIITILLFHIPMLYVAAGISSLFLLRKLWYKITGLFRREKQYKTKRTLAYLVLVALTSLAAGLAIRFKVGFTRNMDKLHKALYSIIFIAAAVMLLRIMFFLEIFGPNPKYKIAIDTGLGIRSHGPKPPGCECWYMKQLNNQILDAARLNLVTPFSEVDNLNETKTDGNNIEKPETMQEVKFFSAGCYLINKGRSSATITHYHPAVDKFFNNNRKDGFNFTEIPERTTQESLLLGWLSSRSAS